MSKRLTIKDWKEDERPREKMAVLGPESLTDAELTAIIIGSGTRDESAVDVARALIEKHGNCMWTLASASIESLISVKGIGKSKAITLLAAVEMGKRVSSARSKELPEITSSQSAAKIISPLLMDLPYEECWVMYLNRANRLISKNRMSKGGISSTVVDVKLIVKGALEKLASAIILAHNHPSGNAKPGESDKTQTKLLKDAASYFDITLLDHIIIAGDKYFSFADDGII
ncbi:MAG: DNA repair protein RadC [Bacteroidales bacterium]|nr:DNA repair protein RadC [Bacteroidales bacterium]MDD3272688.1 DNA repair protein RadC [Bacteroidales bacterium]